MTSSLFSKLWLGKKRDSAPASFPPVATSEVDKRTLSCPCHPNEPLPQPNMLCDGCREFVDKCHWIQMHKVPRAQVVKLSARKWRRGAANVYDGDASGDTWWHYKHLISESGCHLCAMLRSLLEFETESGYGSSQKCHVPTHLSVKSNPASRDDAELRIMVINEEEERTIGSLTMSCIWTEESINSTSSEGPDVPSSGNDLILTYFPVMGGCTGSEANTSLAKTWIEDCRKTHSKCREAESSPVGQHPCRLINVAKESEDPFLFEIQPPDSVPEYLTLSHCWGASQHMCLTTSNHEALKSKIPFMDLPKTFQEAISTVRRLGYTYIWIDSLCIIQDSQPDWKREASFMGRIYQNSICTIAATASPDGQGGCFRLRDPLSSRPCHLLDNRNCNIRVDVKKQTVAEHYHSNVNLAPLNTRAWVLQERVLSPRTLHYSSSGLYWDCREAHYDDCGYHVTYENSLGWGFKDGELRVFDDIGTSLVKNDFHNSWKSSVEKYCAMKLTVSSDRLIAFTGIIKYIESVTAEKCKYGIWQNDVLSDLLWRIENPLSNTIPKHMDVCPTWSWVSNSGLIRYFPPSKDDMATGFWYPLNEGGWPERIHSGNPADIIDEITEDMSRQMHDAIHPENGYSSEKVYCAEVEEASSVDNIICLSGRLNKPLGKVFVVGEEFTFSQETEIINSVRINDDTEKHKIATCIWLDIIPGADSESLLYLQIHVQGAKAPKLQALLINDRPISSDAVVEYVAPYALYTTGLVLQPAEKEGHYVRKGFFRAIETFPSAPPAHPNGFHPETSFYENGWFGAGCGKCIIRII